MRPRRSATTRMPWPVQYLTGKAQLARNLARAASIARERRSQWLTTHAAAPACTRSSPAAARGIGRAIAERLAALGASLTLLGRDRARLYETVQALGGAATCDAQPCDVRDERSVAAGVRARSHARAIGLGDAGQQRGARGQRAPRAPPTPRCGTTCIAVNLTGVYLCTRAALPALLDAPAGRIVNIASTAGLVGYPYVTAYCAAKHGVIGLTRALALELATTRVTVNAVCPGYTETDLVRERHRQHRRAHRQERRPRRGRR